MEPQSIKNILERVLRHDRMNDRIDECKALLLWDDVAPNLASRTQAVGINRGRLSVNVADNVILHQLTLYKKKYMDKINLMMGKRVVRDIVFRMGKIEKREKAAENRDDYIGRLHSIELDSDEIEKIDDIVSQIEDEEIQNSLRKLFISQSKLTKMREED